MNLLDWLMLFCAAMLGFVIHAALVAGQAPEKPAPAPAHGTLGRPCLPDGTCTGNLVCRDGRHGGSVFEFYGCDPVEVAK